MSPKFHVVGALLMTSSLMSAACADDIQAAVFSFHGFGTLGAARSSEGQADFASGMLSPDGAGYTRTWSMDVDTRIGGQVDIKPTRQLSAVLQVVAEHGHDDTYKPSVEWANLKYAFTPDFSLRVGRISLPGLLAVDYRKVGYAVPWARPPAEVYALRPVTSSDGIDALYRARVGELVMSWQAYYGSNEAKAPSSSSTVTAKSRDGFGIVSTVESGELTLQATYHQTRLTVPSFGPLFDAYRQFGAKGAAIADKYDTKDKPYRFIAAGGNYDAGKWFASAEWASVSTHSVMSDRTAWYVGGGYRMGSFTPYAIYSRLKVDSNTSDPGVSDPAAAGLNAALDAILSTAPVQQTISVGARWDVMRNAAFKLQYDYIDIGAGSPGLLINRQPGFRPGGEVKVVSLVFDFLF